ncbi:MAG: hypothetical protein R3E18_06135 [Sphingomonadaceae bacterium]
MVGFDQLEEHPLRTGIIWGVTFIPVFALITRVTQERWLEASEWAGLVPGAIVVGVAWAFIYRHILRGEKRPQEDV